MVRQKPFVQNSLCVMSDLDWVEDIPPGIDIDCGFAPSPSSAHPPREAGHGVRPRRMVQ